MFHVFVSKCFMWPCRALFRRERNGGKVVVVDPRRTGTAERAQIRIQWPDGEWSAPYRVFANNFVVIRKGSEQAQYWYPPE